jgi:melanoma-associated antigen p97
MPISTLIEKKLLDIVDCNNHVKAATRFFNKMCAPDALNAQFNPTGDNPTSACELCGGRIDDSTFCTNQDKYAGSIGAMYCLMDGGGHVAFVKHTTLNELAAMNRSVDLNNFELLCPNVGSTYITQGYNVSFYPFPTAPLSDYLTCNWGVVPARAILTSGRKALLQRRSYRDFLRDSVSRYIIKSFLGHN